jgi:hypothetical protein
MTALSTWLARLAFIPFLFSTCVFVCAGGVTITGTIEDPSGRPLSGGLVCLVSLKYRTRQIITNGDGKFSLFIAPSEGPTFEVPFLEVYLGDSLMYRQRLTAVPIARARDLAEGSDEENLDSTNDTWRRLLSRPTAIDLEPLRLGRPE